MRAYRLSATWAPRDGAPSAPRRASGHLNWRHPQLTEVSAPDPSPRPDQVVVEVGVCGVCGSDTHCVETDAEGYLRFSGPVRLPCILGHEVAGRVVGMGAAVRGLSLGELVCAEGMLSCGACEACKRGMPNQCTHLDMLGFSADGGFAERMAIGARHLWSLTPLADALGSERQALEWGSMVEPIACAFNGIWIAAGGMKPGATVAVYGCGPIGLGAILLTRAAGASRIVAFDALPERAALARACGADVAWAMPELVDAGGTPAQIVREATAGWGADMSVEAAGAGRQTVPEMELSLAPGGTILYLGRTGDRIPLEMDTLVTQAARVVGSRGHASGGCYPSLLRMMAAGILDPSPMVTARIPLGEADAALKRSKARTDGKILLIGAA